MKKTDNYFDFDTIFLISYTVTFFIYPLFLYPIDPYFFKMFYFEFNEDYINKSTALSLVGSCSYCAGRAKMATKTLAKGASLVHKKRRLPSIQFVLLAYLLFLLFYITGGLSHLSEMYNSGMSHVNTVSGYIHIMLLPVIFISIVTQFNNSALINNRFIIRNFNPLFIIFLILYSLSIIMTGSRGAVIGVVLVVIWSYTYFYRSIKLLPLIMIVVSGAIVLALVGVLRTQEDSSQLRFIDVFMDLIINNRSSFIALEYVDNNGITYGKSMLGSILRAVPLLSGFVHSYFQLNIFETTSSMLLTSITLGENFTLGLGTNIIADLYLSFGVVGVILGMNILGKVIAYMENRLQTNSSYVFIAYAVFISISVSIVRIEYFNVLNRLMFAFFFYAILSRIQLRR